MYIIKTEQTFDSAHFLSGYDGKCRNLHGHTWRVIIEVSGDKLAADGSSRGMVLDFSQLKSDLKSETEKLDHALIYEEGTLRPSTVKALLEENFKICAVPFRPTSECFAKYFYDKMTSYGYSVTCATVYETPANCASYKEQ